MKPTVIVTRPEHQAAPILQALAARGYHTEHLPLMHIAPLPDDNSTGALRQLIQNLDEYSAVVVISMNAAELGLRWLDAYWPQPPVGIDWIAVGPSTAELLTNAGLSVHCPESGFDTEAMLALPCLQPERIAGKKVLLWRGIGGREKLASSLRGFGVQVDYAELYERQEIHYSAQKWQAALASRPILMLSSTQALDIVTAQRPSLAEEIGALIVPAQRSADDAKTRGFTKVVTAASARDEDMLACLVQAEQ